MIGKSQDHLSAVSDDEADAIYTILVRECCALEGDRWHFVQHQVDGCREYRFGGLLGFGGKFWNYGDRWYVTAYSEDMGDVRSEIINRVNGLLAALKGSFRGNSGP